MVGAVTLTAAGFAPAFQELGIARASPWRQPPWCFAGDGIASLRVEGWPEDALGSEEACALLLFPIPVGRCVEPHGSRGEQRHQLEVHGAAGLHWWKLAAAAGGGLIRCYVCWLVTLHDIMAS